MMTPRERVRAALAHAQPDFTPCDYYATPEIHAGLIEYFGLTHAPGASKVGFAPMGGPGDNLIPERLGTDIRYIAPPYMGPPLPSFDDGSTMDLWGIRRRPVPNQFGEYAEPVHSPYAEWTTTQQAAAFPWPDPNWFDYDAMPTICARYPDMALAAGSFGVQDFINGVAFGRGVEQVLMDIAEENPVYMYIVERRHKFYLEYIERILQAAGGRIDMVLCGDDFGSQRGPLIAPAAFDRLFAPKKKALFDLAHAHGAKISHHCCGSSRALIPRFIACGMDALQTIQARAEGMEPYGLKRDFGDQLAFHGAVDVQGWLQAATPEEIEAEVNRLMDEVGHGGGYILGPSHQLQPDTPIDNVLTVYRTVARRRGRTL